MPSLAVMRKDNPTLCLSLVTGHLVGLNEFLSVPRKMNENQMRETALMIVQDFFYLKLADLNLAFRKIKSGEVQLFEGLDGAKVMSAVREYCQERDWVAESTSFQEHQKRKFEAANDLPMAPEVAELLAKSYPGKPKDPEPEKVHTEQEEIAHLAQEYIRQEKKYRIANPEANKYQFEKDNGTLEEWVKNEYKKLFPDAHKMIFEGSPDRRK